MDGTRHAKFCSDRFRGFCSPNTWFCRAFGVTSMFVFWGSRWLYFIFGLLNFRKTAISGTDFDWTCFFLRIGNSGSQNCYVWFWGTSYAQVTWYCACAVNFVAFIMEKRYFLPITWLNLRRSALKVTKWIGKLGSGISKMWIIFAPG